MDKLEAKLLSGAPLDGVAVQERSGTPEPTTDDELASVMSDDDDHKTTLRQGGQPSSSSANGAPKSQHVPDHDGPNTGAKGVIADAAAARSAADRTRRDVAAAFRNEQERRAITAATFLEEQARGSEDAELDRIRQKRLAEFRARAVRDIGKAEFVHAVERKGWVLVMLYEPDILRCTTLLAMLASLPLDCPLLRARAGAVGFSLLPDMSSTRLDDEVPPFADELDADDPHSTWYERTDAGVADPDVLPTLLAYKDGEVRHTWVRVDLEAEKSGGVETLLRSADVPFREVDSDDDDFDQ